MADQIFTGRRLDMTLGSEYLRPRRSRAGLILLILFWGLAWSCAPTQVKPPAVSFYVTPEITYLLDSPKPGGNVLGPLYKGDKVDRVGEEGDWRRVVLLRSGQTGWVRKELLSPEPVPASFYFVNEDAANLRECPRRDCLALQQLSRGERVQKVEEGPQGWWRVLVLSSRSLGWLPAAALTERSQEARRQHPSRNYYYVKALRLNLRAQPSTRSEVIRTLKLNDQVQKIEQKEGWIKVRQPSSGAVGWVLGRELESLPLKAAPRGQTPAKEGEEPQPLQPVGEPQMEPEFM